MGSLRLQWTPATANTTNLNSLFGTFEPPVTGSTPLDTGTMTAAINTSRAKFAEQYNDMLHPAHELREGRGYNGTNLLYGQTLDMVFNPDSTTRMLIRGVVFDYARPRPRDQRHAPEHAVRHGDLRGARQARRRDQADPRAAGDLRLEQHGRGHTRQDFIKDSIKTLKDGADNLVVADLNEEGANLLALQTRQQLSTQALSLASQSEQAVLRLFG